MEFDIRSASKNYKAPRPRIRPRGLPGSRRSRSAFRLPGAANAPNPSLGDAVLPGEFLVVVAGELFLDAGVADGAGEALGLRDIDRSASDDLGQLVEVIRPDCLAIIR